MIKEKSDPAFIEERSQELIEQVSKERIQVTEKEGGAVIDVKTG